MESDERRQKTALQSELRAVEVGPQVVRSLGELAYTAEEVGILGFALKGDEDLQLVIRLVKLAERYASEGHPCGVPHMLRM